MKYLYIAVNSVLIIMISISLFVKPKERDISMKRVAKSLMTSNFTPVQLRTEEKVEEEVKEEVPTIDNNVTQMEEAVNNNIATASVVTDVLETQVGSMSAYGPDCRGCSGHLGGGFDASAGNYIYQDATFGDVRIVAGDPKYPYGTIIRVKGVENDFNAIVLDRGGAIGIGRRFMFDLLFPSEANAASFGTHYNLTFEVLRYGY